MRLRILLPAVVLVTAAIVLIVMMRPKDQMEHPPQHVMVHADQLAWSDGPSAFPAGAKMAMLQGDPSREGMFTMRLKFPPNYRIAPHWHNQDEHITVLEGDFAMGMGDRFDAAELDEMKPGDFVMMEKGMRHFAYTKGGVIIQVHGRGPWTMTYVDPADDPNQLRASR